MGYKGSVIKGFSWMGGLQTFARGLTFIKIAVLARLLTPSQFGVFGVAALLLSFLEIITETGINIILVQSKRNIEEIIDSAWVVSIIRGFVIFLGIIILAPFIASFFNSPDSYGIILFISLAPLIRGFINPAIINFQKELKFKYEFSFRSLLFFVDAISAIIFALITHSVYSLAIGLVVSAVFEVILSFALIRPLPKLKIDKDYLREIFHKGKWITGQSLLNYLGENSDNIIVGRLLGTTPLGLYQNAYRVSIIPITEVSDVMNKVTLPVYSKIQEDKSRLKNALLKTIKFNFIATFIIGMIIFLFPSEVIKIVLGPQWLMAADVLRVLAVFGIIRAFFSPISVLLLATGNQKLLSFSSLIRVIFLVGLIFPLISQFGLIGAAYSQVISAIISSLVMLYYGSKVLREI